MFKYLVLSSAVLAASWAEASCPRGPRAVRISFVGDILVHKVLFQSATTSSERFKILWKDLIPTMRSADYMVGNLEGPVAPKLKVGGIEAAQDPGFKHDGTVYSGTNFLFNYHPYIIDDLLASGFDLVTTANNHTMDRGSAGVLKTIAQLQSKGLAFVGTTTKDQAVPFLRSTVVKGLRVGFIACTEALNGFSDPHKLSLSCRSSQVTELVKASRAANQATIVLPHWGAEYQGMPNAQQRRWAHAWIDAGATAVVGSHPHVLQTVEWRGKARDTGLIVYSLGNFVAAQKDIARRASAIAHLDFTPDGRLAGFSHTPIARPQGMLSTRLTSPKTLKAEYEHTFRQLGDFVCN